MKVDYVHDVQTAYRKLLDCLAKPGTIHSLRPESAALDLPVACYKSTMMLMLMFLDPEVSFHIIGRRQGDAERYVTQLSGARVSPLGEADFVFVLKDRDQGALIEAIQASRLGDLVAPHLSATVIVEVEKNTAHDELLLSGPGIQWVSPTSIITDAEFVDSRAAKNVEYPLGIEMLFVDEDHRLFAIPRTTTISKVR
ncbi:MAG: hypothetical protein DDT35_00322 [Firmicutes bacterium]|nr:hypothetical protein [Bacillota bacterium]